MPRTILLPCGRELDCESFYAERDQRIGITTPRRSTPFRIGVVFPEEASTTSQGQTAAVWVASMVRRMGEAFSHAVVIASSGTRDSIYLGTLGRWKLTNEVNKLGVAIDQELLDADPFGPVEWRDPATADCLADIDMALWIGFPPQRLRHLGRIPLTGGHVVISFSGWVAAVASGTVVDGAEPEALSGLDGATCAVVLASALAVGVVYRVAHSASTHTPNPPRSHIWVGVDSGAVTTDAAKGNFWMRDGQSQQHSATWHPVAGPPPFCELLTIVSAGALGGNFSQILSGSYASIAGANVVDHDIVDLPGLNRLIGVGVRDLTSHKVTPAVAALRAAGVDATAFAEPYELWSKRGFALRNQLPCTAVVVGVDQVGTRLRVQSDWPSFLVNGGTAGTGWNVSTHYAATAGRSGCIGCLYGLSVQHYSDARRPLACAGVGGSGTRIVRPPMASYPFVSVAAAAMMVGAFLQSLRLRAIGSRVIRMNVLAPEFATAAQLDVGSRCLLLCNTDYVQAALKKHRIRGDCSAATDHDW